MSTLTPPETLMWAAGPTRLRFRLGGESPVALLSWGDLTSAHSALPDWSDHQPLVEITAVGHGLQHGGPTYEASLIGRRLRYESHSISDDGRALSIVQRDAELRLRVETVLRGYTGVRALRAQTIVENQGEHAVRLQSVSSLALGIALDPDSSRVVTGASSWTAEGRWTIEPLRTSSTVQYRPELHGKGHPGGLQVASMGTWSTGRVLTTGGVLDDASHRSLMWQIEHNGAWQYQLTERPSGIAVILMGPTDLESQWSPLLAPGESFQTVPVAIVQAAGGLDQAAAELTRYRRALRGSNGDRVVPLVFNDYMNTLVGDPTTDKLLPLIDAAAAVGAEYFCIDAGWYDDSGKWWDGVGEWQPSTTRFPGGLGEVISRITERGMIPGLWLEPEVIGVRSPMADALPISAFLTRGGERVELSGRYLLDFRSPATIAHLDGVVDRLVADFGVGFLKLDYNATPGAGSDAGGVSPGVGLLEHNRAVVGWLDAVRARHPHLIIENCASGAMRMDYAMLARLDLQSTSDQQDPVLYAAIAAAAPLSMIPEQAANWAYPQPGMTREEQVFALANGMLGALYLSGYINRMSPDEAEFVAEAVRIHKGLRAQISTSVPFWPLGLPDWDAEWVVLGLQTDGDRLLTIWHREGAPAAVDIPLASPGASPLDLTSVFPLDTPGWAFEWAPESGVLRASTTIAEPSARVIRITSHPASLSETPH